MTAHQKKGDEKYAPAFAIQGPRGSGVTTWKTLLGDNYIEIGRRFIHNDMYNLKEAKAAGVSGSVCITDASMYARMLEYGDLSLYEDWISGFKPIGPLLFVWVVNPEYDAPKEELDIYADFIGKTCIYFYVRFTDLSFGIAKLSIPGIMVTRGQPNACSIIHKKMMELIDASDQTRGGGG